MGNLDEKQDYSTEKLLELAKLEGEQTIVTDSIKEIASEIDPDKKLHGTMLVKEVCSYVRTMIPSKNMLNEYYNMYPDKTYDKRSRTAAQLLSEENLLPERRRIRNISGCIETAHIVRALLLAKDIPCLYIETLQKSWCDNNTSTYNFDDPARPPISGYIFLDTYIPDEKRWVTVDPNDGRNTIHEYRDYTKDGMQYIFPKRGKDSWNLGYRREMDFERSVMEYFESTKKPSHPDNFAN